MTATDIQWLDQPDLYSSMFLMALRKAGSHLQTRHLQLEQYLMIHRGGLVPDRPVVES